MPMIFKIGFRNIFRQKRRSLLTTATMFGGFTLCSFSISWSDGSYSNVIDMFTRNQLGHIQIHQREYVDRPTLYRTVDDYESVGTTLETIDGVESWAPRIYSAGLASVREKTTGVRIIGVDPIRENATTRFQRKVTEGRVLAPSPSYEAMLGEGLADRLEAKIGDELVIVSQGADGSIANDLYHIVGLVDSGNKMDDRASLYLHIHDAQELLVLEGRVHEIAVVAPSIRGLHPLADRITAAIDRPELVVETWQEFARSFYDAMRADEKGNWISQVVIIFLVAIGVLNTVLMSVLERTREYGLLRAVGTSPRQVFNLVMAEVFIMAIISVAAGVVASFILNYWFSQHGIPLPLVVEYGGFEFKEMSTEINLRSFLIPLICVISSAVVISTFPALRAARTQPAAAMRSH